MPTQKVIDNANQIQKNGGGITRNGEAPTKNPDPLLSELLIGILLGENKKTNIFDRLNEKYPSIDFREFIFKDLTPETRELLTQNREKLKLDLRNSSEITDKNGAVANDKLIIFLKEYYKCDKAERIKIVGEIEKSLINRLKTIPEWVEGASAEKIDNNGIGNKSK